MEIKNYLNDGANWQAQCVLASLRRHSIRSLIYDLVLIVQILSLRHFPNF